MVKYINPLKWWLSSLGIMLFFNFTFAQDNNKQMSSRTINISTDTFKTVKSDDGIVAIVTIESAEHIRKGTRSEQVHYKVKIENEIFGKPYKFNTIKHYGKPKIEVDKKYLVFLSGSGLFSILDFQRLDCDGCDDIIETCIEKLK